MASSLALAALISLLAGPGWSWVYFGYPLQPPAEPLPFIALHEVDRAAWIGRSMVDGDELLDIHPIDVRGTHGGGALPSGWLERLYEGGRTRAIRERWTPWVRNAKAPLVTKEDVGRLSAALGTSGHAAEPPRAMYGPVIVGRNFQGETVLAASLRGREMSNDHYPYAEVALLLDGPREGTAEVRRFRIDISGLEGLDGATIAGVLLTILGPLFVLVALVAFALRTCWRRHGPLAPEALGASPTP
jgi:hypothetical protein